MEILVKYLLTRVNRGGAEEIRMAKGALRTPALTLSLALCKAYLTSANSLWSAPVTSPMAGSYGILLNQWPNSNTGDDTTGALLGELNFNGAGNVTATYAAVRIAGNTCRRLGFTKSASGKCATCPALSTRRQ
jgi:hypothetical protein